MPEFKIGINDNDSHMCSSTDRVFENMVGLIVCESCGYRKDFEYVNDDFILKRKTYDLSGTYDGYYIASLKLKELTEKEEFNGVDFIPLKNEPEYFAMFVRNIVKFDTEKRKSRSENLCSSCGNYESFIGAKPAFLIERLPSDICRSDVIFGSGNSKHPLLFASQKFVDVVKREKLKGFRFEPVRT
ncbi:MAG: hypothetical protein VYA55_15025 [Pseudomonadota bacterium]|nr:hypothetical protein [Pseudomonadota bacterium]